MDRRSERGFALPERHSAAGRESKSVGLKITIANLAVLKDRMIGLRVVPVPNWPST